MKNNQNVWRKPAQLQKDMDELCDNHPYLEWYQERASYGWICAYISLSCDSN